MKSRSLCTAKQRLVPRSAVLKFFSADRSMMYQMQKLLQVFRDVPSSERSRAELSALGIVDLFAATGLCKSKSDVRRLITSGGAYCNNQRISSQEQKTAELLSADRKVLVLRAGKKNYHLVNVV
jgi:tyrosyl-tRNA synthetase